MLLADHDTDQPVTQRQQFVSEFRYKFLYEHTDLENCKSIDPYMPCLPFQYKVFPSHPY